MNNQMRKKEFEIKKMLIHFEIRNNIESGIDNFFNN